MNDTGMDLVRRARDAHRSLLDLAAAAGRERRPDGSSVVERLEGLDVVRRRLSALERDCRETLGLEPPPSPESSAAADPDRFLPSQACLSRRGVRRATVSAVRLADRPDRAWVERAIAAGVKYRQAPVPFRMQIIDRRHVLLALAPADAAYLTDDPVIVTLAFGTFQAAWAAGAPMTTDGTGELSEQERCVLRLLAEGLTDAAIARRMRISTRSVSRVLTSLTRRAGAGSRFQLALAADRAGWLAPTPSVVRARRRMPA